MNEMRISSLAERSAIPVPTIKFYLREGLLPRGIPRAATQATYGAEHLARLRLIRLLTEVAGLSLADTRAVLGATPDGSAAAVRALRPGGPIGRSTVEVDVFLDDLGWRVDPGSPGRGLLARALTELREAGLDVDAAVFRPHSRAADWLASEEGEIAGSSPERVLAAVVAFDAATTALRHLAWEHRTSPTRARSPAAI